MSAVEPVLTASSYPTDVPPIAAGTLSLAGVNGSSAGPLNGVVPSHDVKKADSGGHDPVTGVGTDGSGIDVGSSGSSSGMIGEHPNEAALVAAAAAMAAAQGHHALGSGQGPTDGVDGVEGKVSGLMAPELSSYFLAAAASIHQQHQQQQEQQQQQEEQQHDHAQTQPPAESDGAAPWGIYPVGPDWEAQQGQIRDACQIYQDDRCPFPLDQGKRLIGGIRAIVDEATAEAGPTAAQAKLDALPKTTIDVGLGQTRCYWALLSASVGPPGGSAEASDDLRFVYLDPVLQHHLCEQADAMVGTSFFDYVHPEERKQACADMRKIVESRTLFGSVTRCRYSRLPRIREMLGATDAPRDPEAHKYVEDEGFVAIDIVINWVGDGMALCFFHAIIDKGPEDNDEANKSTWTNWCGTPAGAFTLRECERMWRQVKASEREPLTLPGPNHVFQVLEAGEGGQVLFSWPPPRLFPGDADERLVELSQIASFNDGSYFAHDFARYAQGVSVAPGSSQLSDANTSCTRRFKAKHQFATEGIFKVIESVLIPYGGIVLACFQIVYQGPMPEPDPELIEQARATLEAARGQIRKNDDDGGGDAPNKRSRDEDWAPAGAASEGTQRPVSPPQPQAAPLPSSGDGQAQVHPHPQPPSSSTPPTRQPPEPGIKANVTEGTPWNQAYGNLPRDPSLGSLNSLANASIEYAAGLQERPARDTQHDKPHRPFDDQNPPISGLGGANDPGGSVATLAAVAAAAAAQTKCCTGCGKSNSPEWRRGPSGHKTLCNACGLRYARSLTRRKKKKGKDGEIEFIEPTGDPSVVPKSRGGGGGSLPGVHRKSSKKRKAEEELKAAAAASGASAAGGSPSTNGSPTPSATPASVDGQVKSTPAPAPAPASGQGQGQPDVKPTAASPATRAPATPVPSAAIAAAAARAAAAAAAAAAPPAPAGASSAASSAAPSTPARQQPNGSQPSAAPVQPPTTKIEEPTATTTASITIPTSINAAALGAPAATPPRPDVEGQSSSLADAQGAPASVPAISVPVSGAEGLNLAVSAAALQSLGAFDANAVSQVLFGQLGPLAGSGATAAPVPAPAPVSSIDAAADSKAQARSASQPLLTEPDPLSADALQAAAQAAIAQGAGALPDVEMADQSSSSAPPAV
ncbi:uncharacterized protein PSFLO_01621 [Pseudozyma flocculosa]|uniref:GATA-type domain-containing protein n=1 Tax=Pseudozyma flocculosa TaxID=84751 RepID=A0A5C3EWB2_9BASI|nr:uncharacterized protein PSFLO_01621 [Pseudozyma flocculosa]